MVLLVLLAACGDNETGPAADEEGPVAVGELGCPDGPFYGEFGSPNYRPEYPGLPSAEEAIRLALEPWMNRFGGEIVLFVADRGSLVVDQRELVTVTVYEVVSGEWVVSKLVSCRGR